MERFKAVSIAGSNNESLPPLKDSERRILQGAVEGLTISEIVEKYQVQSPHAQRVIKDLKYLEISRRTLAGEITVPNFPEELLTPLDENASRIWSLMASGKNRRQITDETGMSKEGIKHFESIIARKWGIKGENRNFRIIAYGITAVLRGQDFLSKD